MLGGRLRLLSPLAVRERRISLERALPRVCRFCFPETRRSVLEQLPTMESAAGIICDSHDIDSRLEIQCVFWLRIPTVMYIYIYIYI